MTRDQEERANRIIERQLAMSGETLEALRRSGLEDGQELQIEFAFAAPTQAAGRSLVVYLEANNCLNLAIQKSGGFFSRKYDVLGKTYPTAVTAQVLAQWIPWIVVQGIVHDCEFDGWGVEIESAGH